MKRIVSVLVAVGCLSMGAGSALAARPAAAAAPTVCTVGHASFELSTLEHYGLSPRMAREVMRVLESLARSPRFGVTCTSSAPAPTPPPVSFN